VFAGQTLWLLFWSCVWVPPKPAAFNEWPEFFRSLAFRLAILWPFIGLMRILMGPRDFLNTARITPGPPAAPPSLEIPQHEGFAGEDTRPAPRRSRSGWTAKAFWPYYFFLALNLYLDRHDLFPLRITPDFFLKWIEWFLFSLCAGYTAVSLFGTIVSLRGLSIKSRMRAILSLAVPIAVLGIFLSHPDWMEKVAEWVVVALCCLPFLFLFLPRPDRGPETLSVVPHENSQAESA
jgi:hypothetical protein